MSSLSVRILRGAFVSFSSESTGLLAMASSCRVVRSLPGSLASTMLALALPRMSEYR